MERLLIKNIRYLYCMDENDTFLENADIYIEENVIKKIGSQSGDAGRRGKSNRRGRKS